MLRFPSGKVWKYLQFQNIFSAQRMKFSIKDFFSKGDQIH